jgi:hypothetical protein
MKKNELKNLILANGEKYTFPNAYVGTPPGETVEPYPIKNAGPRINKKLSNLIQKANALPIGAIPDGKIVTKMTLHPSFLAKSYYPNEIFESYGFESLGSREVFIKPEVAANKEQAKRPVSSSLYYVSGEKKSYEKLLTDIKNNTLDPTIGVEIGRIEDISLFSGLDKLINIPKIDKGSNSVYEVVLHVEESNVAIIEAFSKFVTSLGGSLFNDKTRSVNGLTFCFIKIGILKIENLAEFAYVRVVRPAPVIKFSDFIDEKNNNHPEINTENFDTLNNTTVKPTVAIFDGGLMLNDLNKHYLRYFDLTKSTDEYSSIFMHGEFVTSAIAFGQIQDLLEDDHQIIPVDHYKVFCEADEADIALVNVLDRIEGVLKLNSYKIVNISLGPNVPRPDDEPSLWTSKLDKLAAEGKTLIVVAAGNTGEAADIDGEDLARIQPPADMLNGLSIGAADSIGPIWGKASYSSIGPGRRPGYVKPDALFFGGEAHKGGEKVNLANLNDYTTKALYGTSFAAPLVTRIAALLDRKTLGKLNVPTIRALLIHSAENMGIDKKLCGWGRIAHNLDDILYCKGDSVTLIYKGVLKKSSGIRAAVPCPSLLLNTKAKVNLTATLCFYTDVDQQHTVSYTRSGIEVIFRPHSGRFTWNKEANKYSTEASTRSLFSKKNIMGNEQSLRKNSHKWETCYKVQDSFLTSSVHEPSLDIRYLTRDEGHPLTAQEMKNLKPLPFSLIVTLSVNKTVGLYSEVLKEYLELAPLDVEISNDLNT